MPTTFSIIVPDALVEVLSWHMRRINEARAAEGKPALTLDQVATLFFLDRLSNRREDMRQWLMQRRQQRLESADAATLAQVDTLIGFTET